MASVATLAMLAISARGKNPLFSRVLSFLCFTGNRGIVGNENSLIFGKGRWVVGFKNKKIIKGNSFEPIELNE